MLVEITRNCVIDAKTNAVIGEIIDVSEDKALQLAQANACKQAPEGATVGKPKKAAK